MQFLCIHCQHALSFENELAGRTVECPVCQAVLMIPPRMPDVLNEFIRQFIEANPEKRLSYWIPAQRMVTQGVLCLTRQEIIFLSRKYALELDVKRWPLDDIKEIRIPEKPVFPRIILVLPQEHVEFLVGEEDTVNFRSVWKSIRTGNTGERTDSSIIAKVEDVSEMQTSPPPQAEAFSWRLILELGVVLVIVLAFALANHVFKGKPPAERQVAVSTPTPTQPAIVPPLLTPPTPTPSPKPPIIPTPPFTPTYPEPISSTGWRNLVRNGDFLQGLTDWNLNINQKGQITVKIVDSGTDRGNILFIERLNSRADGTLSGVFQTLDYPLEHVEQLVLEADLKPEMQTLNGTGWYGGEYPADVRLRVDDPSYPNGTRLWFTGLYLRGSNRYENLFLATAGEWRKIRIDLTGLFPPTARLNYIQVIGSGWDYRCYADNIALYVKERDD